MFKKKDKKKDKNKDKLDMLSDKKKVSPQDLIDETIIKIKKKQDSRPDKASFYNEVVEILLDLKNKFN